MNIPTTEEKFDDLKSVIIVSGKVYLPYWQGNVKISTTLEEFHACGNRACIAGHLAISPLFQKHGGGVYLDGAPLLRHVKRMDAYGTNAVELWFFGNENASEKTQMVITGSCDLYRVRNWWRWGSEEAVAALGLLENREKYTDDEFLNLLNGLYECE